MTGSGRSVIVCFISLANPTPSFTNEPLCANIYPHLPHRLYAVADASAPLSLCLRRPFATRQPTECCASRARRGRDRRAYAHSFASICRTEQSERGDPLSRNMAQRRTTHRRLFCRKGGRNGTFLPSDGTNQSTRQACSHCLLWRFVYRRRHFDGRSTRTFPANLWWKRCGMGRLRIAHLAKSSFYPAEMQRHHRVCSRQKAFRQEPTGH